MCASHLLNLDAQHPLTNNIYGDIALVYL